MENNKTKIKVVDSVMGEGKTSWAINYMKENPDKRFLFITPFLDEVERIKNEIPFFYEPKSIRGSKLHHLKELLKYGKNIVTTHQLMDRFDFEVQRDIEIGEYTLILDEVADVVSMYNKMSKADTKYFLDKFVTPDENGYLIWNEENMPSESMETISRFYKEMILCKNKNLILIKDKIMYWELPVSIFKCFKEVYILTYIFQGSLQKAYFDLANIEYEYLSVEKGKLVDFKPTSYETKQELKSLIKLVDREKLNLTGNSANAFGSTWLMNNVDKGTVIQKRIKLDTENFFKNIAQTKAEENMWTTIKGRDDSGSDISGLDDEGDFIPVPTTNRKQKKNIKSLLRGIGYGKDNSHFVPFNIRATNKYQHKRALAFLYNVFPHFNITQYFNIKGKPRGIGIDEEAYALSHLIQWIWRSSIRRQDLPKEEREIHLYLPSSRMRKILLNWLDSKE